jgi:predicted PurR-regulated permease PerM
MMDDYTVREDDSRHWTCGTTLAVIAAILVLAALKATKDIAVPIVLSVFVFFLLSPLLDRLDRLRVPHVLGIVVCFLLVVLIVGLAWWVVYKTVSMLVSMIPVYVDRVGALDRLLTQKFSSYISVPKGETFLSQIPLQWEDMLVGGVTTVSSQLISVIKVCVLVILFVLFMLMEKQLFLPKVFHAFSESNGPMVAMLGQRISRQVSKYLLLKAVISLLTGLMFYLTAMIAGMDVPMLYGVLAFVFNFIPSIGSIIVTILTILMSLIQFAPHWGPVIFVSVMAISTQMILGNIIDPKLQGGQLNLSPVVILISLSIWGYIWGVVGMFIAVPLTSCAEIICANIKSLKPIAVLLSSGKSYERQREQQRKEHRGKNEETAGTEERQQDDAIFPDAVEDKK